MSSASLSLVHFFWEDIFQPANFALVDQLFAPTFVASVNGAPPLEGAVAGFTEWLRKFRTEECGVRPTLEIEDAFQNVDGTRVHTRFYVATLQIDRYVELTGSLTFELDRVTNRFTRAWVQRNEAWRTWSRGTEQERRRMETKARYVGPDREIVLARGVY